MSKIETIKDVFEELLYEYLKDLELSISNPIDRAKALRKEKTRFRRRFNKAVSNEITIYRGEGTLSKLD